jgi:predicted esterase
LLLLHGTGGDENDLVPLAAELLPGAGVLSPRGKVLEQGMPRFFRRLAEGVFDLEDLKLRTGELASFIEEAAKQYGFEKKKLIAVGFSNGANIAASLLLSRADALGGAVLFRAMVPFVPATPVAHDGTPVLLSNGRLDPLVSATETERLATLLRDAGAAVKVEIQPAGHNLTANDIAVARAWLSSLGW